MSGHFLTNSFKNIFQGVNKVLAVNEVSTSQKTDNFSGDGPDAESQFQEKSLKAVSTKLTLITVLRGFKL